MPVLLTVLGLGVLAGCDKGNGSGDRRYCDQTGCYACTDNTNASCYPVPGDPAKPNPGPGTNGCDNDAACGAGSLCNLGVCVPACNGPMDCATGQDCISGRCKPSGSPQCGIAGALCTADTQCGTNRTCVANACAGNCMNSPCAVGQVCTAGACVEDPAPASAQCQFDLDCGGGKGGFRCVNAYCLPTCTTTTQCQGSASCVKGLCRGNRLPG